MNTGRNNIGKCVVLSISMIYLFMSLSYIFFLPNLNGVLPVKLSNERNYSAMSLYKNHNQTSAVWVQKLYKSVPENRRNCVIPKFLMLLLIGIIVGSSGMLRTDILTRSNCAYLTYIKTRSFYLNHCPLRM